MLVLTVCVLVLTVVCWCSLFACSPFVATNFRTSDQTPAQFDLMARTFSMFDKDADGAISVSSPPCHPPVRLCGRSCEIYRELSKGSGTQRRMLKSVRCSKLLTLTKTVSQHCSPSTAHPALSSSVGAGVVGESEFADFFGSRLAGAR